MDLIGEFYPPSKLGHKYALTVICMLMGYVFCIPLKSKQANEVLQAYIDNVYAKFSGSLKILSDNGTEFKNQLFEQIAKELGVKHKIYTVPYRPSSNGRIEGFHNFLKACIAKRYISQLPDYEIFGRQTKLHLNPKNIPDLSWKWADTINTQDIGKVMVSHIFHMDNLLTQDVVETILVNTNVYTHSTNNLCTTVDVCKTVVSSSTKPCSM